MKHFDSKTDEVAGIEGEKRSNRVDVHGRDQPGIMYFRTAVAVLGDQALPLWVYRRDIGQQRQNSLDFFDFAQGGVNRKPSPLLSRGRVATFQNSEMF
jgi:hypothetical protein